MAPVRKPRRKVDIVAIRDRIRDADERVKRTAAETAHELAKLGTHDGVAAFVRDARDE